MEGTAMCIWNHFCQGKIFSHTKRSLRISNVPRDLWIVNCYYVISGLPFLVYALDSYLDFLGHSVMRVNIDISLDWFFFFHETFNGADKTNDGQNNRSH